MNNNYMPKYYNSLKKKIEDLDNSSDINKKIKNNITSYVSVSYIPEINHEI